MQTANPPHADAQPAAAATPSPREYIGVLLVAAALGVPTAFLAAGLMAAIHGVTTFVWTDVPDAAGWNAPPGWYVVAVPALAGLVVAATLRMPGRGGHPAAGDLALDPIGPIGLASALLAAVASLALGIVLGPEAPLVALGLTAGLVASRALRAGGQTAGQLITVAGAFAAISTIFGGPLPSALLLFEMAALKGLVPSTALGAALLPGFVASGTAALVFTGIDDWPGVSESVLSLPQLPAYPTVRLADVAWCALVAAATGIAVAGARRAARGGYARSERRRTAALVAGGVAVGALAVAFRALADEPVDLVLFSGEDALGPIVAEGSAGVLALLVLVKGLAYTLSLGAGFRGGPTFPAVALGVGIAALGANVLPGLDLTPAIVAGTAAGAAAALRLPFFGALIAVLMAGSAASETVPIAVLASATGWLAATALWTRRPVADQAAA